MHKTLRSNAKKQRLFLLCAGIILLGISTAIALFALEDNMVFFYTPSTMTEKGITPGESFRLGGLVKNGSIVRGEDSTISFIVSDGSAEIKVTYTGILPNLFREGQGVVAEGMLTQDNTFLAKSVLAKHDENYMPQEMHQTLKKKGLLKETP